MGFSMVPYEMLKTKVLISIALLIETHSDKRKTASEPDLQFIKKHIEDLKKTHNVRYEEISVLLTTIERLDSLPQKDDSRKDVILNGLTYFTRDKIEASYIGRAPSNSNFFITLGRVLRLSKTNMPTSQEKISMYLPLAEFLSSDKKEYTRQLLEKIKKMEIKLLPGADSDEIFQYPQTIGKSPDYASDQSLEKYTELRAKVYVVIYDLLVSHKFVTVKSGHTNTHQEIINANISKLLPKIDRYNQSQFLLTTIAILDKSHYSEADRLDILNAAIFMVIGKIRESYENGGVLSTFFTASLTSVKNSGLYSSLVRIVGDDQPVYEQLTCLYERLIDFLKQHVFAKHDDAYIVSAKDQRIYLEGHKYHFPGSSYTIEEDLTWLYSQVYKLKVRAIEMSDSLGDEAEQAHSSAAGASSSSLS